MKYLLLIIILTGIPCLIFAQVVNLNSGIQVIAHGSISLVIDRGGLKNDGIFTAGNSTVFFDGPSATTITGSQGVTFYNITFRGTGIKINNGNSSVINTLAVEGTTVLDADGINDDKPFTLKSSDTATANVDKLTTGDITGDIIVERFINTGTIPGQHTKSWQFLATPTFGQTYFQSWQEEGLTPPGFGTWITGMGTGFDAVTALPSLKFFDQTVGNWTAVTNTGNILQNKLGYMLFVRGDRTVTTFNGSPNNTNMRSKGKLFTAFNTPPSVPVIAGQFQTFGNPYASRIEFDKVYQTSTGINNVFYVWDPQLNGTWNLGGYQTISAVTSYVATPGNTSYYPAGVPSPFIESGQAVFVQGNGLGGNINFNENCKISGSRLVNKKTLNYNSLTTNRQFLSCALFTNTGTIADGNIIAFENGLGNNLNEYDAKKILNDGENFCIVRNEKLLAVEARDEIIISDTIFYYMQNLRQQSYQLRFAPVNIPAGMTCFLIDRFHNSSTLISLIDSSFIDFDVVAEPGSNAPDRFLLVFQRATVVPIRVLNIAAIRNSDQTDLVTWKVENEINLQKYIIERSMNGCNFVSLGSTFPSANNGGGCFLSLS